MAEKVAKAGVKRQEGYLYFIDKNGDVSRAKMARGGDDRAPAAGAFAAPGRHPRSPDCVRRGWRSLGWRLREAQRALFDGRDRASQDATHPAGARRQPRSAAKGPKEPTRGVGIDAIAAVSLRSTSPG